MNYRIFLEQVMIPKVSIEWIYQIIGEQVGVDDNTIHPKTEFRKDLHCDNLDMDEIASECHAIFDTLISDKDLSKCKTVQDLFILIKHLQNKVLSEGKIIPFPSQKKADNLQQKADELRKDIDKLKNHFKSRKRKSRYKQMKYRIRGQIAKKVGTGFGIASAAALYASHRAKKKYAESQKDKPTD